MITFSERLKIAAIFREWCKEHKAEKSLENLVAFLQIQEALNEEKIKEVIKNGTREI